MIPRPIRALVVALFFGTLIVRLLAALPLEHAGYFDAFYYYHIGLNIAEGRGLTEALIWNYLDRPTELPRPGNQYWMPLTSFWVWLGIEAAGGLLGTWRAAQLPFVVASALLPPLSAWLAWQAWSNRRWALGAGLLTLFSGFYFIYWGVTDNFTPFALTVALTLLAAWKGGETADLRWWSLAGVGAGLSHLARADGALLALLVAILVGARTLGGPARSPRRFVTLGIAAAFGYLLVMGPWFARNLLEVGTPFPGGGTRTMWLRQYNELFAYEPDLTLERYLAWGPVAIVGSKLRGLVWSALIVLGSTQFFLAPFILLTLREAWARPLFRPFLLYGLMLLTIIPLLFTLPATRGTLLHSSAALLPWMMALAPRGIARAVEWAAARRASWDATAAGRAFGGGFVAIAALVTLYLYAGAIWMPPAERALNPRWNERTALAESVEQWLREARVAPDEPILVIDPPAYTVRNQRPSLVIPSEGPEVAARAARDWSATWMLLEHDHAPAYEEMYLQRAPAAGWEPAATFTDPLGRTAILYRYDG